MEKQISISHTGRPLPFLMHPQYFIVAFPFKLVSPPVFLVHTPNPPRSLVDVLRSHSEPPPSLLPFPHSTSEFIPFSPLHYNYFPYKSNSTLPNFNILHWYSLPFLLFFLAYVHPPTTIIRTHDSFACSTSFIFQFPSFTVVPSIPSPM